MFPVKRLERMHEELNRYYLQVITYPKADPNYNLSHSGYKHMSDNELRDQNEKKYEKNLQSVNEISRQIMEGGWDGLYKNIEEIPWVDKDLDFDLENELNIMQLNKGVFLDVGTGTGTQAIQLAQRGFNIIASDISEIIIKKNKIRYENKFPNLEFVVDNILESRFKDNYFDFIFDRGCFHIFTKEDRSKYYKEVKRILKEKGRLYLKCLSSEEPVINAGSKFSTVEIRNIFGNDFEIQKIKQTFYRGTFDPLPKALFVVMRLIKK
jgi:ubiquinone/menaquinone biosynthesis C-methylase UbiE